MKALIHIGLLLIWLAYQPVAQAQVRITAHVTAEVVEASSIAPATHNILAFHHHDSVDNINLGHITISGISSAVCNVIIKTSFLKNQDGESISFATNNASPQTTKVLDARGHGRINLSAAADNKILSRNYQQYAGGYNINFIYN